MKNLIKIFLFILSFYQWSAFSCQNLTPKKINSKWGFVDQNNIWIIKPKFDEAKGFSEGIAPVKKKNKWGYINQEGKFVVKPSFGNAKQFHEGYAAVLSPEPIYNKEMRAQYLAWGYINQLGELKIPYQYRDAKHFDNNLAEVSTWDMNKKAKFYINHEGKTAFPPHIKKTLINETTYYLENKRSDNNSVFCYANFKNGQLSDWYLNDFHQDTFPILVLVPKKPGNDTLPTSAYNGDVKKTLTAYLGRDYKVFSPWYEEIGKENLGYRPVKHNHKWGLIDKNFKYITKPIYIDIQLLKDGLYSVTKELNSNYLTNEKGEIISIRADRFEQFDKKYVLGVYVIDSKNYYCLFDNNGIQKSSWYNKIHPFRNTIARVEEFFPARSNKNIDEVSYYNYIKDSSGEVLTTWRRSNSIIWEKNRQLKDSVLQFLYAPNSKYHITSEFFETILTKQIEYNNKSISFAGGDFHYGMAIVSSTQDSTSFNSKGINYQTIKQKEGYINWLGKQVIPNNFEEGFDFSNGKAIIKKGSKYGAINLRGRVIIQPKFELLGNFGNGLAPVFIDSVWGYINSVGKVVIQPQYDEVRPFKNAFAAVKKGKKWGLINQQGGLILPYNYLKPPEALNNEKIRVLKNGVGYIEIDIPS